MEITVVANNTEDAQKYISYLREMDIGFKMFIVGEWKTTEIHDGWATPVLATGRGIPCRSIDGQNVVTVLADGEQFQAVPVFDSQDKPGIIFHLMKI